MVIFKEKHRKAKSNSETCSKHTKTSKNISAWWFGHPENMKVNWGGIIFKEEWTMFFSRPADESRWK